MKTQNVLVFAVKLWLFNYIFTFIDLSVQNNIIKSRKCVECNDRLIDQKRNWFTRRFSEKDTKDYLYINYKEAYGIRFDPNSLQRLQRLQTTDNTLDDAALGNVDTGSGTMVEMSPAGMLPEGNNSTEVPIESPEMEIMNMTAVPATTVETLPTMAPTESAAIPVTSSTPLSTTMTAPSKRPGGSFPFLGTVKPLRSNVTNVMQPTSTLRDTLDFIRTRLKQLFTSGLNLNIPISNGQRFLSVFNVINLESVPCTSTQPLITEMSGVCYHDYDCSQKGGTAIDACADGLGVCCICKSSHFKRICKNYSAIQKKIISFS